MNPKNLKISLLAGFILVLIIVLLSKCHHGKQQHSDDNPVLYQDTVFLSQWRKERKEKEILVKAFEHKIASLKAQNKILRQAVNQSKQKLGNYRTQADSLDSQVQRTVYRFAQKDSSIADTLVPLIQNLSAIRDSSDSQCDTTISLLEKTILNRDSTVLFQKQIENQLRDFNKEQALQNAYLTSQLNNAYKQQKKKSRQNKLLSGGILLLSGITAGVLIINSKR